MSTKLSFWLVPLFFVVCSALPLHAQQNPNENRTVTGCLRQGIEPGGYYLDSHDGKMWELRGNVDRSNVGREVTVEGHEQKLSMSPQAELVTDEKQEANGRPYQGLEVIRIKTVSNSCH